MHIAEFIANVSKAFQACPSMDGHIFVSVDKQLNVVPEADPERVSTIKLVFSRELPPIGN